MQNKIWGAVVILLIVSLAALYLAFSEPRAVEENLDEVAQRLDLEIQRINRSISPGVPVGNPVGFVIEFENGAKFYIAGDTAMMADMKYVIHDYYRPDVAILPAGDNFTMGLKGAAYATSLVRPAKYVIPYHYNSYPVLEQDPTDLIKELEKYDLGIETLIFEPGETKTIMGIETTWLGHAGLFFVSPEGTRILVDPSIQYNPAYPEEYKDVVAFERVDMILLTHGHPDHVVVPDLQRMAGSYKPVILATYDLQLWLEQYIDTPFAYGLNVGAEVSRALLLKGGIPDENLTHISDDLKIHITSAVHSSSAVPVE